MSQSSSRAGRWLSPSPWLVAAAVLLPVLLLSVSTFEVIDDAYITARYAHNLALGRGLVYNLGEHVEGMTDLLWALVLALPARLGMHVDRAAVVLGVAFALLSLLGSMRVARLLGATAWAAWFAAVLLALNLHYWLTMANGLEGGLFSLLLVLTIEAVLRARAPVLVGLLCGLLFLTRPESGLVALIVAGYLFLEPSRSTSTPHGHVHRALLVLLSFGMVAGAATVFRLSYYGALLPNSITAKSVPLHDGALVMDNVYRGVRYVARFGRNSFTVAAGALLALWLAPSRAVVLLLLVVGSEVPAVLLNGGDWMHHERLLVVYAPLLASLLALTLDRLWQLRSQGGAGRLRANLALLLLLLANVHTLVHNEWHVPHASAEPGGIIGCYQQIGRRLAPVLRKGDVVATEALGLIGYELPDHYVHDPLGLTDAWVSRHGTYRPRIGRIDYGYTYGKIHPGVLLMHQDDVTVAPFAQAGGSHYESDYAAYYVDPPPPCDPWEQQRMIIVVRSDLRARVLPALFDLALTPIAAPKPTSTPALAGAHEP
jgi:arabinofuranosyltransferase